MLNLGPGGLIDELVLTRFNPRSWDVVDFSETVLRECDEWMPRRRLPVTFHQADFRHLPIPDAFMDTVLDFSSTDHVGDADRVWVRREIFRVLGQMHDSGTTIVVVEQNAMLALAYAEHAYVLETGRVVLGGEASDLQKNESVRRSYLGY